MNHLWKFYLSALDTTPLQTKSLTAAVLSLFSDILAQSLSGVPLSKLNTQSLKNQFILGLIIRGPIVHYWYILLEYMFSCAGLNSPPSRANSLSVALGKVVVDQTLFSPLFNLLYFYAIGFLENRSLVSIDQQISKEYAPVMIANYKIWPLVNIINFKLIPPNMRVLFGNIVGILWTAYMIKLTKK